MVCWAECLGDCNTKQSREHIISKSLFPGSMVTVHGFPWCKDQPKDIGIANLTAKILCIPHNNTLSPLDESARRAFDVLREVARLKNVRESLSPRYWKLVKYSVDGIALERWFLKTLINIAFGGKYRIGSDSNTPGKPSCRLVRIAYGMERFQQRAGLYAIARVGMEMTLEDRVSFTPIMTTGEQMVAGLFTFRGFHFMLYLEPEGPHDLRGILFQGEHLVDSKLLFQKMTFKVKTGKCLSQVLNITR